MRQTRAGSIARSIETIVIEESDRLGRGVTGREAHSAWARCNGDVPLKNFVGNLTSLVKSGILVAVEGSYGHTRYAHHSDLKTRAGDDGAGMLAVVYDALCAAHAAKVATCAGQTDVLTNDVTLALRATGRLLPGHTITENLLRLSRGGSRGHNEWKISRAIRTRAISPGGRATNWWRPADALDPPSRDARPRSRRDATLVAVATAVKELGRPAAATEIGEWVKACRDSDPVAAALNASVIAQEIRFAVSSVKLPRGNQVARNRGNLACHGGAETYWYVTDDSTRAEQPAGVAACRIADVIAVYLPEHEVAGISDLSAEARMLECAPLLRLADLRRTLLRTRVAAEVGDIAIIAAVDLLRRSISTVTGWAEAALGSWAPRSDYQKRRAENTLKGCDAIADLCRRPISLDHCEISYVGIAATLERADVCRLALAAGLLRGEDAAMRLLPRAFGDTRRFPGAMGPAAAVQRPPGFTSASAPIVLDRVEVLVCIHTCVGLPGALALIHSALALMGHVLRDAAVIRRVLDEIRLGEAPARRALVVALGLLGESVSFETGVSDPNDPLDIEAYILASTLVGAQYGLEAATLVYNSATNALAWDVADAALARLEAGDIVGVVG